MTLSLCDEIWLNVTMSTNSNDSLKKESISTRHVAKCWIYLHYFGFLIIPLLALPPASLSLNISLDCFEPIASLQIPLDSSWRMKLKTARKLIKSPIFKNNQKIKNKNTINEMQRLPHGQALHLITSPTLEAVFWLSYIPNKQVHKKINCEKMAMLLFHSARSPYGLLVSILLVSFHHHKNMYFCGRGTCLLCNDNGIIAKKKYFTNVMFCKYKQILWHLFYIFSNHMEKVYVFIPVIPSISPTCLNGSSRYGQDLLESFIRFIDW